MAGDETNLAHSSLDLAMCTMSYSRWYKFEADRLIWVKVMAEFDIVTNVHLDLHSMP